MENHSCECSKCGKILYCPKNREAHEKKCDGSHAMQCPRCWKEFPNKMGKSRHVAKATCIAVPKPAPVAAPTATNVDQSGHVSNCNFGDSATVSIDNSTDNSVNTTNNHITVIQQNDFFMTSAAPVVDMIMRNPAPIQLANERRHNKLDEALAQATHWGPEVNRNVYGIEGHGRMMFGRIGGKRGAMDRNEGIMKMTQTVREVAADPAIKELLGGKVRLADNDTPQAMAALKPRYAMVIENAGRFGNCIMVPPGQPHFCTEDQMREMILEAADKVTVDFRPNPALFKPVVSEYCRRFAYVKGEWFVGAGGLTGLETEEDVLDKIKHVDLTDIEDDIYDYDPDAEPKTPPKKAVVVLHPSHVDRTKVGWQFLGKLSTNMRGLPVHIEHLVVDAIRTEIMGIRDEYAHILYACRDDAGSMERSEALSRIRRNLEWVDQDLLKELTDNALWAIIRTSGEGVPYSWEPYV